MDANRELDLCKNVETGLCDEYERLPELTDAMCVLGLDNSIVALKQKFGFARNETVLHRPEIDGIIEHVLKVGLDNIDTSGVTLKDYIAVVTKIKKSVIRHANFGPQAYYEFIRNYV